VPRRRSSPQAFRANRDPGVARGAGLPDGVKERRWLTG
jgi:hypothetical protein